MDALLLVGLHYAAKKLGPILYPEVLWEGGINLEILLFIHYELLIFNVLAICVCGGWGGGGGGVESCCIICILNVILGFVDV